MTNDIIPQVLPSMSIALRGAAQARLNKRITEEDAKTVADAITVIVMQTFDRIGQKNTSDGVVSVLMEDLIDTAITRYPFLTLMEISLAMKGGACDNLPTKSFHFTSQVATTWLREWVEGPRRDVTEELMRLRPKTELRLPENTEPLWKNGYKNYCEGRYPYGTPMMYQELVEEGRIMLSSEEKWKYLRRAVEEDRREYEAQQHSTNKTIRMKAVERLAAHKDLDIEKHVPDWLITVTQYLIVTEYFDKLKALEGDSGAA